MEITGSVAFVSGGSAGLGARICALLAANGADVAVGYRKGPERAETVCAAIRAAGRKALAVPLDLADPGSAARAVAQVAERLGALDILINNAGMASGGHALPPGDLEAFTPEIWNEMIGVNLSGPFYLTRAGAPCLRASRWGRVVNLASTIGHGPWGAAAGYAPSKGAVVSLTRYLAAALAPEVSVNCISPGLMEGTRMSGGAPQDYVAAWRDRAVLNATTSIEDVAQQVLTFCKSETVTGQTLVMDGGIHFN